MRQAYPIPNVRGGYALGADLPGTPVNLSMLAVGMGALALAAFFLGGGEPRQPLRIRKTKSRRPAGESQGVTPAVVDDAISALRNLGYSTKQAAKAVTAAQRKGHRSFDSIFNAAQRQLG